MCDHASIVKESLADVFHAIETCFAWKVLQVRNMASKGKQPWAPPFSHLQVQCDYKRLQRSFLALLEKSVGASRIALRLSEGYMLCIFPHPGDRSYSPHMPI